MTSRIASVAETTLGDPWLDRDALGPLVSGAGESISDKKKTLVGNGCADGGMSGSQTPSLWAKAAQETCDEGPVGQLEGEGVAQVAPGRYEVTFVRHELRSLFGGSALKLVIWFRVVTPGPAHGNLVPKYYNVKKRAATAERGRSFAIGAKSDFYRDYVRLFDLTPKRKDRISLNPFRGVVFEAQIRFVERDSRQQRLAGGAWYSIINRLLGVVT